jgi:N-acetylmuramoyl-L-alanine amidase
MKVYVIAGHNRMSPGALAHDGTYEHYWTERLQNKVVNKVKDYISLEGSSINVVSETDDLSNERVINLINSTSRIGDIGIDIHFNNNNPSATGTEVVISPNTNLSNKNRASMLVRTVADCLGIPVRRRERSRDYIFPSETFIGKNGMIERTNIPMILLEVCFLNEKDLTRYKEKENEVAQIIKAVMFKMKF